MLGVSLVGDPLPAVGNKKGVICGLANPRSKPESLSQLLQTNPKSVRHGLKLPNIDNTEQVKNDPDNKIGNDGDCKIL